MFPGSDSTGQPSGEAGDQQHSRPGQETSLQAIVDGLVEIILEASDAEILAATREEGLDPAREAQAVRSCLLEAIEAFDDARNADTAPVGKSATKRA